MLEQLRNEFAIVGDPSIVIIAVRLIGAMLLCGFIGYEREVHKNTRWLAYKYAGWWRFRLFRHYNLNDAEFAFGR